MLTREEIYDYFATLTPDEKLFRELHLHPADIFVQNEMNPELREKYEQWTAEYKYVPWMKKLDNADAASELKTVERQQGHLAEIMLSDAKELETVFHDIKIVRHIRYLAIGFHGHEFIEISYVYNGNCRHVFQTEAGQQETMWHAACMRLPCSVITKSARDSYLRRLSCRYWRITGM